MPSGTKGSWKRALSPAYTRSQCRSIVLPMPMAGPATAATTGLGIAGRWRNSFAIGGSTASARGLRKSAMSLPAVKQSRLPCSSTTRASRLSAAAASASPSCVYISPMKAFFFSGRWISIRAMRFSVLARIKLVVLHLLAQRELGELAGRRMRQLLDEDDVVGHPPLGDLALVEPEHLLLRDLLAGFLHRNDDRPLVPFRVLDPDHRGFRDRRMRHRDVLEV